ncbi:MAG: hypothetical protein L3J75_15990 [Methylococcaceae bacterium]|nr:hypothetical protein [Methylococcaceae bacterium]
MTDKRWALRDLKNAVKALDKAKRLFLNQSEADLNSPRSKKLDEVLSELFDDTCPYLTIDTEELYK